MSGKHTDLHVYTHTHTHTHTQVLRARCHYVLSGKHTDFLVTKSSIDEILAGKEHVLAGKEQEVFGGCDVEERLKNVVRKIEVAQRLFLFLFLFFKK